MTFEIDIDSPEIAGKVRTDRIQVVWREILRASTTPSLRLEESDNDMYLSAGPWDRCVAIRPHHIDASPVNMEMNFSFVGQWQWRSPLTFSLVIATAISIGEIGDNLLTPNDWFLNTNEEGISPAQLLAYAAIPAEEDVLEFDKAVSRWSHRFNVA